MTNSNIRTRFAPSPTGYLHLGGLRTALFNYLFARSQGGKFILRIEDTDRSRFVPGAVENLLDIFAWLGIDFDEGPHKNGNYAPYIQSERLNIYREYAEKMLRQGHAYRCFCSAERLEELRKEQISRGENPMYDRKCRDISQAESQRRSENEPFVIRLKMPLEGEIRFEDGIRGFISFQADGIDDQVLIKSDGFPTYHLANVVDDHLMEISDVIRGEEWVTSTPKHIHLYHCFAWQPPKFHHLPLILNPDRSKLSKRQGDVAVEDYRAKGYLPDALINYIALLGWHPADDREFMSREEIMQSFSLERVSKSPAVFDIVKLNWLNQQHMNILSDEEFIDVAGKYLPKEFNYTGDLGMNILRAVRERVEMFSQIPAIINQFTGERKLPLQGEAYDWIADEMSQRLFRHILDKLAETANWDTDAFKELIKSAGKACGVKGKGLWMPVRAALTGEIHGPELGLIAQTLGREKFKALIEEALKLGF